MATNIRIAKQILKKLEVIQFLLSKYVFKDKNVVSTFLQRFIYDFDRIEDPQVRFYQYEKNKKFIQKKLKKSPL